MAASREATRPVAAHSSRSYSSRGLLTSHLASTGAANCATEYLDAHAALTSLNADYAVLNAAASIEVGAPRVETQNRINCFARSTSLNGLLEPSAFAPSFLELIRVILGEPALASSSVCLLSA